jgi:putative transposase
MDRDIPEIADPETGEMRREIKNIWFKRIGPRWYCGLQVEVPVRTNRDGLGKEAIGVDWGTSVLAALSSGETIPNPRHGEASQKEYARAQRAVARRRKGSKRRLKARRHAQAVARRIANSRRNTFDKVSARLVKQFALIADEKIDAKRLMNAERPGETLPAFVKRRRNREALDAAPYLLRQMVAYKARRECAEVVTIDPLEKVADGTMAQPTQRCSMCWQLHFKELTDDHVCTAPGLFQGIRLPRKVNAARVLLALAQGGYGISSFAEESRGGPVPGGLSGGNAVVRNADSGPHRLGNTQAGQPARGRRGPSRQDQGPLLPHARDARDPRLQRSPGW